MATLAQGCALVTTTPNELISELVHGENVWLVSRENQKALSEAIIFLMQDETSRMKLKNGAKKLAKNFTWDEIAKRTLEFYQSIEDPRQGNVY